ncbi:MAG TPA: asparagine synthase (glutamine-hydrolyzing), partial [Bradyrhizobium sp.]|nr:asparagine synthase (glutamine-hydrolyzing) [Bradyrhizobium sp.]
MCGIAGIVDVSGKPVTSDEISGLTDLLAHRGPAGSAIWLSADQTVALGHRRLAIIDPGPGGRQPMAYADGRYVITYNGEIYNFLELRRELEARGAIFRTESDTEVILAAWQAWGEDMLLRFNGMWALAILDTRSNDLFLARDRFGIKPLLYAMTPQRLVFASEQRALLRSRLIATSVDTEVARRLLLDAFGIEGSERTLCREIRRLQGGHSMWLRNGRLDIRRWWRTVDHLPALPKTEAERVAHFGELFRDAVGLRMRSDVPIGTCLSGGFDSSAVICTMAAHESAGMGPRDSTAWRHAFVATFPGAMNDERPQAEEAAAYAGVQPTFLEIGEGEALPDIDRILDDTDDVYIGLASSIWLIYRELRRQNVPVSLDGHGADELMGAY